MIHVTDNTLRAMTDDIVRAAQPVAVVLFGSHARGAARPDSDVDGLIQEAGGNDRHA